MKNSDGLILSDRSEIKKFPKQVMKCYDNSPDNASTFQYLLNTHLDIPTSIVKMTGSKRTPHSFHLWHIHIEEVKNEMKTRPQAVTL